MKEIVTASKFKKDYKAFKNNDQVELALRDVLNHLLNDESLPDKYKDHQLIGQFKGCRDCHLLNDVILIYEVTQTEVFLIRIGNHSNLFG